MWYRTEDDTKIDIQPRGEEGRHIADLACECVPAQSLSDDGRLMIIHKTFDGAVGFRLAGSERRRRVA